MSISVYSNAFIESKMGFDGNHQLLKEMLTSHTNTNAQISSVSSVLFRDWGQGVSNNCKRQELSGRKLSYCMKRSMINLILKKNNYLLPNGEPDEATKMPSEIDDFIAKIFDSMPL